ncbi:MAG TPA: hypothetical protein VMG63_24440 [Terriglobia bacterium]|nr:hypothetical protein [Terriglobia bacterium]
MSALDWLPTLLAAAGNSDITDQLLKGANWATGLTRRAFGALERCHTAVGPGEHFGAVVGSEDNYGVVGFADIVKVSWLSVKWRSYVPR